MAPVLLQLCVGVVTVIQLTSSQSTYDIIQQDNDVQSCGRTAHVLNELVEANSQLVSAISQLQKDVAELKASNRQKDMNGTNNYCEINYTVMLVIE